MECYIINPALSLLMKHLVIGQRQKATNFSAFHWSPHGSLVSIGQYFVTTRVVHLPKRTETSVITESDHTASKHQLSRPAQPGPIPDQAVGAVHSCNSWLLLPLCIKHISMLCWCAQNIFDVPLNSFVSGVSKGGIKGLLRYF